MKDFVKAFNKDCSSFKFFHSKFSTLIYAKIRAIVFNKSQIHELMKDFSFNQVLTSDEKRALKWFKTVSSQFFLKKRSPNYEDMVDV